VVLVAGLLLPATLFTQQKVNSARLSSLSGNVTVKGPGASEATPAQANTLIEEGAEVSTSASSVANVKLDSWSTIELRELTKADFTQLSTDAEGNRLSVVTLEQGHARFRLDPDKHDSYKVQIADATVSSTGKVEFDASLSQGTMQVRVLGGAVVVSAHSGSLTLAKGRFLEYRPSDEPQAAKSHARVVRLSYLTGNVTLRRPGSAEDEKALLNTPIQEGFELSTADSSYAEVEFENGSTARIGERSKLLFEQLALDSNGNKLNGLTFKQGYGTFHFAPERQPGNQRGRNDAIRLQPDEDVYRVKIADATITAGDKCEFRTDLAEDRFRVEVLKGSVEVAADNQSTKLGEGRVLERQIGSATLASNTQKGIVKDDWDRWAEARDRQEDLTGKDEAVHPTGPSYGWSDLNTYGEWVTLPGNRFGWSPYAPVGWSPYSYGMWQSYPGMGLTWISGDPWGWVTDHCGFWDFDPTFGWYWMNPMFGCGLWYPSFVNWFGGPGWIGWQPVNPRRVPPGRPRPIGTPLHSAREIVKVPASVFQKGQMITAQVVTHVPATAGSRIEEPAFEPGQRTTSTSNPTTAMAAHAPAGAPASGLRIGAIHATAPPTILMGGDAAKESVLLTSHGFHSGREPLRAAQGATLGGRYHVYGATGEFRGTAGTGGGLFGRGGAGGRNGGPVISGRSGGSGVAVASHGSSGGGASRGGGGGASSSGGGGYSGGGGGGHSSGGGGASAGGGGGGAGGGGHH
jgi:ferric-dicitrate binding protein FerR (iron transport regulator)